jgi:hypothetical protein
MHSYVIATLSPALFYLTLKVDVTIQNITGSDQTKIGVEVVTSEKGGCYVQLSSLEGRIDNTDDFAKSVVEVLKRCLADWKKSYVYELDWAADNRFAIDPELYDILPSSLLDFVEIDDDLLFLSSKGVAHFSDTVPLYRIKMT